MNTDSYKRQLLELESELIKRNTRHLGGARELADEARLNTGDRSIDDEIADEELTEADLDTRRLRLVRDALQRIEDGTYGRCGVDGEPIEEKRLQAAPWARYCLKHQQEIEERRQMRTPTL